MTTTSCTKVASKFYCKLCDYTTSRKSSYFKHLLTLKHTETTNTTEKLQKVANYVCDCGKKYQHHSSLWKHKKNCTTSDETEKEKEPEKKQDNPITNENVLELLKQNNEFKSLIVDLVGKGIGNTINTNTNTNSHNTTNKNKFNLNIFLNEQCKDAMNIMDFVDSLKLQLSDLERVGELGYTKGISNIIVTALQKIDVFKRPIHCSDIKRETMYVKDENAWEKEDTNKEKMTKMIKQVAYKNVKQIPEWQGENPEYKDNESTVHDQYLKIVNESMGGCNEEEDSKNYNKIAKTIAKEVIIERESETAE